jgi:hypothetical protein
MNVAGGKIGDGGCICNNCKCKTFFNKTLFKIGYLHMEHDALQKQLEIKQSMLEEKIKQVVLG